MPFFVLTRNYALSGFGHVSNFIKGEPTWVAPILAKAAIGIGAECVDEEIDVLGEEVEPATELTPDERETLLFAAFDQLEARTGSEEFRNDYNAQGLPNVKALEKITGFLASSKERNEAFQKYRESKAA